MGLESEYGESFVAEQERLQRRAEKAEAERDRLLHTGQQLCKEVSRLSAAHDDLGVREALYFWRAAADSIGGRE